MDRGQGKVDRETGYEKDKVTRRVNRWTSRQVNKLLEMGDKVTEERRKVTEGVLSLTELHRRTEHTKTHRDIKSTDNTDRYN